jgi:hypothetical protein
VIVGPGHAGLAMSRCLAELYRGRDPEWWMDAAGVLDDRYDEADDIGRARRDNPPVVLGLARNGIRTIIWAAGYRPDYAWLQLPVLNRKGLIDHDGGIVRAPGVYLMGMPFLRRRKSALIDGAGDDARDLSAHLMCHPDNAARR